MAARGGRVAYENYSNDDDGSYDDDNYSYGSRDSMGESYTRSPPLAQRPRQQLVPAQSGEVSVVDTLNRSFEVAEGYLNDLSDNYVFDLRPEYRLKARKKLQLATVGVNYEANARQYELIAKRGRDAKMPLWKAIEKVVVTPQQTEVRVYSSKLEYGVLALQCVYGHEWTSGQNGFQWRVTTGWDLTPTSVGRKAALPKVLPMVNTSVRWDVSIEKMPDVGGAMGTGYPGFDYDLGKFRFTLPRLQATLKL